MNTKEFFKVNDNTTAQEIATVMGTIRKAETTTTASDQRNTRNASQIKETDIANASIIQRLSERTFLLKEGSEVYLVAAPNVSDTIIKIKTPIPSLADLSEDTYAKRKQIKESMK